MVAMISMPMTYYPGKSCVHLLDARVKVLLMLAFSVALFFIDSWTGLLLAAALFSVFFGLSRLPARLLGKTLLPLYVIFAFTLLFNSFIFDAAGTVASAAALEGGTAMGGSLIPGDGFVEAFVSAAPMPLLGPLAFLPLGCLQGVFVVGRMMLLVLSALLVAYTTTSDRLVDALAWFLSPLRVLRVPVRDIAMVFSVALRFIPLTVREFSFVQMAQRARGASFDEGSLAQRLRTWSGVLIPLFVNMFRRADTLATAMDVRGYGLCERPASLRAMRASTGDYAALALGCAACILLAGLL